MLLGCLGGCAGLLGIPSDVDRDTVLDGAETGVPDGPVPGDEGPLVEAGTDAGADAAGEAGPCDLSKPFGGVVPLAGVNTSEDEGSPHLSENELTLYLDAYRTAKASESYDVYFTTRATLTSPWGPLQTFTSVDSSINTTLPESDPNLTVDGKTLFFERQGATTSNQLWMATRASASDAFGPAKMITSLDTTSFDAEIYVRGDGSEVWFTRGTGSFNTDLALARRVGSDYMVDTTGVLDAVNDPNYFDGYPVVSKDGLTLYFGSERTAPPPLGALNIYVAKRATTNDPFGAPALVEEVNTPERDYPGFVSADGCRLYFSSADRVGGPGKQDLYVVTRPQ